ncbi:OLC1v1010471C1 [Oldenlandia corymbosa var. corymbosa]|uniref:OLC1v1010471C1 n=1 Tax=Oldenlandia corymbosa var. corymbosa TaxID=529605 RepID=A0AAV1DT40_OLDCO|nr:OLC1v1010471C1 [Oldenlandia corymbosa var. corymbosa]
MNSLANSTLSVKHSGTQFISGTSAQRNEFLGSSSVLFLPCSQKNLKSLKCRRSLTVQASGDGRPGSASIFVGGFVLGGLVVGALGCIYAPQISKALAGTDRKEIMRKLPKFIYDEEKALEKTRKILTEKIEQLNAAIDDVSSQLRADDASPNGAAAVTSDEFEASI